MDIEPFNFIKKKIRAKLSTGILTIYDLLQYDIKKLYITGISFYNTDIVGKKNGVLMTNGMKREIALMKSLYRDDRRIVCDDVLNELLERE